MSGAKVDYVNPLNSDTALSPGTTGGGWDDDGITVASFEAEKVASTRKRVAGRGILLARRKRQPPQQHQQEEATQEIAASAAQAHRASNSTDDTFEMEDEQHARNDRLANAISSTDDDKDTFESKDENNLSTKRKVFRVRPHMDRAPILAGYKASRSLANSIGAGSHVMLHKLRRRFEIDEHEDFADDDRIAAANEMWGRLLRIIDFKDDHSLNVNELSEGLGVIQHVWSSMTALYRCGKADFVQHLVHKCNDPNLLMEMMNGVREELRGLSSVQQAEIAREHGVDDEALMVSANSLADKIVAAEGIRESLRQELSKQSNAFLTVRGNMSGLAHLRTNLLSNAREAEKKQTAWAELTGGSIYIAGITNRGRLEEEGELLQLLEGTYGTVLAVEVRIRARPQTSWGIATFKDTTSHDKAIADQGGLLTQQYGITLSNVDELKAASSTGAFGDVWRRCSSAVSEGHTQIIAQQAWRKRQINALVVHEPEHGVLRAARASAEATVTKDLRMLLLDARVDHDADATRPDLESLLLKNATAVRGKEPWARSLRRELAMLPVAQLIARSRNVDDPLAKRLGDHGVGDLERGALLNMLWEAELRCELNLHFQTLMHRANHAALVHRAKGAGVPEAELLVADDKLFALILETLLDDLCPADSTCNVLLPCCIAAAKALGGKLSNNVDLCAMINDLVDENADAVLVSGDMSVYERSDSGLHPVYNALLATLTDPYLKHVVLPQLENWLELHAVLDFSRSGTVPLRDMRQGLQTACARDIDIMQTSTMVDEVLESAVFVMRRRQILEETIALTVDNVAQLPDFPSGLSTITQMQERLSNATFYCKALMSDGYDKFSVAMQRVAHSAATKRNIEKLDGLLFSLWVASRDLVNAISSQIWKEGHILAQNAKLSAELVELKVCLQEDVMSKCTQIMDTHAETYSMGQREEAYIVRMHILRKYVKAYLLRRRLKLLARAQAWASGDGAPLAKLQKRMRTIIERRRLRRLNEDPDQATAAELSLVDAADMLDSNEMRYFDWALVLLEYLPSKTSLASRDTAVQSMLTALRSSAEKTLQGETDSNEEPVGPLDDEDLDPNGKANRVEPGLDATSQVDSQFPQILMHSEAMKEKLRLLQQTRNRWNELLLMLDKTNSGFLYPTGVRCSLMCFAEVRGAISLTLRICAYADPVRTNLLAAVGFQMGIITELEELQPMNEQYDTCLRPIHVYDKSKGKKKRIGWDPNLDAGFQDWRPYESPCVRPGKELVDFPIHFAQDECILTGSEGVILDKDWALTVEFQFDIQQPDQFEPHLRYSILVSSYRNNSIVVRASGSMQQPGVQILFVPGDAFKTMAQAAAKCQEYEQVGRTASSATFPPGDGRYEVTGFIPCEQLRWYRLEIQGSRQTSSRNRDTDECSCQLHVRMDPLNHKTRESMQAEDTSPHYDDCGRYQPSDAMEQRWFDGTPEGRVNRPRAKPKKTKRSEPDLPIQAPWFYTCWTGRIDFADVYGIGNCFDNLCDDTSTELTWSVGAMSNFRLYAIRRSWLKNIVKRWPETGRTAEDGLDSRSESRSPSSSPSASPRATEDWTSSPIWATESDDQSKEVSFDLKHFLHQVETSADHALFLDMGGANSRKDKRWVIRGVYHLSAVLKETPREAGSFPWATFNPFSGMFFLYQECTWECLLLQMAAWKALAYLIKSCLGANNRGYNLPLSCELRNDWNEDYDPTFPYSSSVVNRRGATFLEKKTNKTSRLIKGFLSSLPADTDSGRKHAHWQLPEDRKLDSSALASARSSVSIVNPGLNSLFTGSQLRKTMKAMARRKDIRKPKCRKLMKFVLFPPVIIWRFITQKIEVEPNNFDLGPAEMVLFFVRKVQMQSLPGRRALVILFGAWCSVVYVLIGQLILDHSVLHELEPKIALLYYFWAGILMAIEASDEILRLPTDTPFSLAYYKAEISTTPIRLTRLGNGQEINVTVMGFIQMVCRLHKSEDDEEEEEDEEDEAERDPFTISRKKLQQVWEQSELQASLPFAEPGVSTADVIYDYEIAKKRVQSAADWEDQNDVFMNSMNTLMDTGRPTARGNNIIIALAAMNAIIGVVHRAVLGETVIGDPVGAGSIVIVNLVVTFLCSYIVYRSLWHLTFTWYMVLNFVEQLSQSLLIDTAMQVHLPCYCEMRHEGNLEAWFMGRRYFVNVFGTKNQAKVALSLLVCAGFSVQAVNNYFADPEEIDWSNPGGWFCLLNMLILLILLFLALVAMERINKCTVKLANMLDQVSIEVSRGITLESEVRLESDKERLDGEAEQKQKERQHQETLDRRRRDHFQENSVSGAQPAAEADAVERTATALEERLTTLEERLAALVDAKLAATKKDLDETLLEINVNTNDVVNRHDISQEAHLLQVVITELRGPGGTKKIFGMVVDRAMLSNIFGGVLAMLYVVLKSTVDGILLTWLPPSPMKMALAHTGVFGGGADENLMDGGGASSLGGGGDGSGGG